jgi:hypothetical protein
MHIKDWLPDARELRHAPALIGLEKLTTLLWSMAVTAIGLGFVWWFGGPPTPFGWVIVVLSLFILTLLAFGMTRWALAGTAWAFWEPSYSADKIESLRAAATSLRDILWGLNVPDADARLQAFRTVGEDFIYEQPFKSLLPRIERNATRMRIMAALPPAGPQAPDPAAFTQCMQDGHAAVEDLMPRGQMGESRQGADYTKRSDCK